MLVAISPAKTLDYETALPSRKNSQPRLLTESQKLIPVLRDYSSDDLRALMGVSEQIAELNVNRFREWSVPFSPANARQAVFAFKGDVYEGLQAYNLKAKDIDFAQKHLRILSGLYGVLRPLDLVQAYRLEMGIKLETPTSKNLYEFWGRQVTDLLNEDLKNQRVKALINLASNEYFKSVKKPYFHGEIYTPQFLDWKSGEYKMISFFAKKARGMMSRYIIDNRLQKPKDLKSFALAGYAYCPDRSTEKDFVFTRRLDD